MIFVVLECKSVAKIFFIFEILCGDSNVFVILVVHRDWHLTSGAFERPIISNLLCQVLVEDVAFFDVA